uniref:Heterogeneous nuclear ribonucleoprotein 1 n=1 Tax=Noccaea caerulescens TaxID=107243 RepID=A0A1J3E8J7_NOCCA
MDSDQGKLFVGGISWETDEEKLKEHFSNYGDVSQAIVMRDKLTGRPRGFGFVIFSDPSVLERVLQEKHHIDTREVDVKRAMSREEQQVSGRPGNPSRGSVGDAHNKTKKIFVGGLPPTLTDDEFRQYFEVYGPVADVVIMHDQATNRPRGFGFVSFDSEEAVDLVLHKTFHDLSGKQVEVKRALPKDANPGGAGRSMGGGGYQGYGGNENSYEGRMDSNRFLQHQNVGNGLPSYGSSGYGAGYGNGSNGVGYGGYGGYTSSAGGYGAGAAAAYGATGMPGAGYGNSTGVPPRNSWETPAPSGYGNQGYGNGAAHSGYGVPGAAPSAQPQSGYSNQAYGYGGYSGSDSGYGNQAAYGAVGGRPGGGGVSNNPGSGGGYMGGGGYGDGSWRSDPSQGYGGGYNDGQGRQGQ